MFGRKEWFGDSESPPLLGKLGWKWTTAQMNRNHLKKIKQPPYFSKHAAEESISNMFMRVWNRWYYFKEWNNWYSEFPSVGAKVA